MMWDLVMIRILAMINADNALITIFGTSVRMAGSGAMTIPVLEYTLIVDTEKELWAPFEIQFDLWTTTAAQNRAAERALRGLLHRDLPITTTDTKFWGTYADGSMLATPDRSGYTGRALRFNFVPLRAQYAKLP